MCLYGSRQPVQDRDRYLNRQWNLYIKLLLCINTIKLNYGNFKQDNHNCVIFIICLYKPHTQCGDDQPRQVRPSCCRSFSARFWSGRAFYYYYYHPIHHHHHKQDTEDWTIDLPMWSTVFQCLCSVGDTQYYKEIDVVVVVNTKPAVTWTRRDN